eukprot:augustus_masked-scaffold_5-processed-gene-0.42-mRNA-1 protein AED:1.00 eAED:1.00 QI:0/0/0/0/1/1/3/0/207
MLAIHYEMPRRKVREVVGEFVDEGEGLIEGDANDGLEVGNRVNVVDLGKFREEVGEDVGLNVSTFVAEAEGELVEVMGLLIGDLEGPMVESCVRVIGDVVGVLMRLQVRACLGLSAGDPVGSALEDTVCPLVGILIAANDGFIVGENVGEEVGPVVGMEVGDRNGFRVGDTEGYWTDGLMGESVGEFITFLGDSIAESISVLQQYPF